MKLTKDQRFTAYCIMLAEAKPFARRYYYDKGFCHLIQETFGLTNRPGSVIYTNVTEFFPEIQNKKGYGWPSWNKGGWQIRIEILKQCIIETHP